MTITIPMWLLYVVGSIIAIILLLFCSYVGIIFYGVFMNLLKNLENECRRFLTCARQR